MASSSNVATGLDCLKYIVDTVTTDSGTEDISVIAMTMLTKLVKSKSITTTDGKEAVDYTKSIINSQGPILNRLRARIQELPEHLGTRTNAALQAYRTEDLGTGWNDEKALDKPIGEGQPFMRASQLVELIVEKNDRDSEIKILQAEVDHRLETAGTSGWIPSGLRDA